VGTVKIQAQEYPLKKIFSDDFAFSIPIYQRPYRWGEEQATELLDDLLNAMGPGAAQQQVESDPYFLGSIVLIKPEGRPEAEVVDGQQRLTTLTILIAVLRTFLPENFAKDTRTYLFQEGNAVEGTPRAIASKSQ
jgi:uncharacterized protein with ParB-like and HNH nuclease domain